MLDSRTSSLPSYHTVDANQRHASAYRHSASSSFAGTYYKPEPIIPIIAPSEPCSSTEFPPRPLPRPRPPQPIDILEPIDRTDQNVHKLRFRERIRILINGKTTYAPKQSAAPEASCSTEGHCCVPANGYWPATYT